MVLNHLSSNKRVREKNRIIINETAAGRVVIVLPSKMVARALAWISTPGVMA